MADSTSGTCEVCGKGRGVPGAHAVLTWPDGKSRYLPLCANCVTEVAEYFGEAGKESRGENRRKEPAKAEGQGGSF